MANHGSNAIFVLALFFISFVDTSTAEWLTHGRDISNKRSEIGGTINPISVRLGLLRQRWEFLAGFDITATPSAANGVVYFPSWNGNLYAVNAANGALIWQRNIGQLTELPPTGTYVNVAVDACGGRRSPHYWHLWPGLCCRCHALGRNICLVYPGRSRPLEPCHGVWNSLQRVYLRLYCFSGFYVGVSSLEVTLPAERCCTFRGSLVKIDVNSGKILWQTYTLPDNGGKLGGYAGAGIWGSSPSIDDTSTVSSTSRETAKGQEEAHRESDEGEEDASAEESEGSSSRESSPELPKRISRRPAKLDDYV
ncbi:hypothetical protein SASPL_110522 [Salvia splendens]|uniref:Polyvinyl alcohol dehydrogenase (Cytochrome) n=1 Tax=Salvia splendens TaxID=180675 RepID=A0A8X8Y4S8_SALSN|nr:hypothetical protein SASPL_110522 [Salvia splendens]